LWCDRPTHLSFCQRAKPTRSRASCVLARRLQNKPPRRFEAEKLDVLHSAREAARLAVDEARDAKLRATAAIIIAAGAMLAAMASAFIAFLALRHWTMSTLCPTRQRNMSARGNGLNKGFPP